MSEARKWLAAKSRRHHNNKGERQIKRGKTATSLEHICRKLKLPFRSGKQEHPNDRDH